MILNMVKLQIRQFKQMEEGKLNWVNVINFLEKEYTEISHREKDWLFEKQTLNQRILDLENELKSTFNICENMVNRIKILEIALKEQKCKKETKNTLNQPKISLIQKYGLQKKVDQNQHQQFLKNILAEIDTFQKREKVPIKLDTQHFEYKNNNLSLKNKQNLKLVQIQKFNAHLDSTKMYLSQQKHLLVTASQDCLLKLWKFDSTTFSSKPERQVLSKSFLFKGEFQPSKTIRQDLGQLFCLTGGTINQQTIIFSGGSEGLIRSYTLQSEKDIDSFKLAGAHQNGPKKNQQDHIIWDLQYKNNRLLSSSSDGIVRLFDLTESNDNFSAFELTLAKEYRQKSFNQTVMRWMSKETFLTGCSNSPRAILWNVDGKIHQRYLYDIEKNKDPLFFQINAFEFSQNLKILMAGCEDGIIRLFDYNTSKIVRKITANSSISSLLLRNNNQIFGGTSNGDINVWDLRNYKVLTTIKEAHLRKYDSGVLCLAELGSCVLSCGADGMVKMFG